ncbi:FKBP-type peptidyl-prolyl cis-trans isomerase [Microbacterium sp. NPDC055910]|uniref:FKBP-type peptidyl-prolyl cis-trans isomerase n=1 Tax=Microbacterium sp. NPDC055910 TaxID=3345659 RepID=UPI0035D84422
MRIRSLAALSVSAVALLALAGCGSADPEATPTSSADAGGDLCSVAQPSGPIVESLEVGGEVGESATLEFDAPLTVETAERLVLTEGDGDPLSDGDLVTYALTVFDASTGEETGTEGYGEDLLPVQVSVGTGPDQFFGCATVGSRIVMSLPESQGSPAAIWVLDVLGTSESVAWGEEQDPVDGFPTVELDESGAPTVTLPEGDIPTEFDKATLKKGDGVEVKEGDAVLVQYHGVSWNDGEVFDQSWGSQPFSFSTSGGVVQGFADAVIGETVGSQVIAVLPPSAAYGEGEINEEDLTGQTLVFVVDILAVATPATQ